MANCTHPKGWTHCNWCGQHNATNIAALAAQLAEAERDAARYRFIKRWVRRLDITGYSLTNNEYFELRIDQEMGRTADSASALSADHGQVDSVGAYTER